MGIVGKVKEVQKKKAESAQKKLTNMILMDIYECMEKLLDKNGFTFFILDDPDPNTGRYYETNAPEELRKELHNQALDQVKEHHQAFGYPDIIMNMVIEQLEAIKET